MFERIKEMFSQPEMTKTPKPWERDVRNSYRILQFQIKQTQERMFNEGFKPNEESERMAKRVSNFSSLVIDSALFANSIFEKPKHVAFDRDYFYFPASNTVSVAPSTVIKTYFGRYESIPNLNMARPVNPNMWLLNESLLNGLSSELLSLLPKDSKKRILVKDLNDL